MTQDDWKDASGNFITFNSFTKDEAWARVKMLLSISDTTPVLWSQTSTQYGNTGSIRFLYSYVIQQPSGVQKQIFFATEYLTQGSGWRKVYLIGKDFPLSQVPSASIPVGACCPAGSQWSSVQNKCSVLLASGCAEGQYYCSTEDVCKPAGQTCSTVTCNNNNTCEAGESCNCGDCTNGGADDKDKCGLTSTGAQMVCTKDAKNTTTSTAVSTEKWVAYTYPGYASSYIYLSKIPPVTTIG